MTDFKSNEKPFITLKNATLRVYNRLILPDTSWEIKTGQHWAVIGPNGAGKTSLARALIGDVPVVRGSIRRHDPQPQRQWIGYVSFELHRAMIAREENRDHARHFSGNIDDMTTAGEVIRAAASPGGPDRPDFHRIVGGLQIQHLLDRGIRYLSNGEMRKVLIARALVKSPRLLILDEPFDGLDASSRSLLGSRIGALLNGTTQLILITHRTAEIFPEISHVMQLNGNSVAAQGPREEILAAPGCAAAAEKPLPEIRMPEPHAPTEPAPDILVAMKNVSVRYGDVWALKHLDWTMRRGENWAVVGPNGSGKTTLLRLIAADLPQAYANDIRLFGRRRGTGESIWEIRRRIGLVGGAFHIHYRRSISALDVVLSGFFDSVGLYRSAGPDQRQTARHWMRALDIGNLADRPFDRLSYGQQRIVLIARAVVKSPPAAAARRTLPGFGRRPPKNCPQCHCVHRQPHPHAPAVCDPSRARNAARYRPCAETGQPLVRRTAMNIKAAVTEFSQSEKIKAGIIWATQSLNLLSGMPGPEKKGAESAIRTLIGMIGQEAHLARKATGDTIWMNTEKNIDMAMVMIDSGVPREAAFHLTRALGQVTSRAQRAMSVLVASGLL